VASRDEIQAMIIQVKEAATEASALAAAAKEACEQSADEEGGKGHEGIASLYRSGAEALEKVVAGFLAAQTEAEQAQSSVAQTQN